MQMWSAVLLQTNSQDPLAIPIPTTHKSHRQNLKQFFLPIKQYFIVLNLHTWIQYILVMSIPPVSLQIYVFFIFLLLKTTCIR